jgi:tagatose 6-phosphate kinase
VTPVPAPFGGTVLFVTLSPAIDRTARVARIALGRPMRPTEVVALPGGKGINAARAARRLGATVMTTGLAGGHAGRWLVEALEREGLAPRFATARAETRTTYVTVDGRGRSVIVYEPSVPVTTDELGDFLALLREELLPAAAWVVASGVVPAGAGRDASAAVVRACRDAGRPVLLDGSGPALLAATAAGPDVVKVGRSEVADAGAVATGASAAEAAAALVGHGARLAVVTDGRRAVAATDGRLTWRATVPRVRAVNAVGSGDAFNAGLVMALGQGRSLEEALARGVAAGTANALALSAGSLDPGLVDEMAGRVRVRADGRAGAERPVGSRRPARSERPAVSRHRARSR